MENEGRNINDDKKTKREVEKKVDNSTKLKQNVSRPNNYRRPRKNYTPNRRYNAKNSNKKNTTDKNGLSKYPFQKISVLVPLFNEEESLEKLARQIRDVFSKITPDYEIFFVDDGSTDNSLKIIKDLIRKSNKIRYVSFRKNYGKSAALNVGFKSVSGDVVITMDADLQDDPSEIPNLLKEMQKGFDLVSGWKKKRHDPFIKKYSSRFFNYITKVMSGIKIHDFNCGLKAYRKAVVKNINVQGELHRYIPVLADWKGFKISEVVVQHHPRRYGKTKFGVSRFYRGFIDLITVIFTTRYIKRPLHFFGILGAISFLVGFVIDSYLAILWLLNKIYLSNRPLLYLGAVLIVVGVQFFSLGLIGEMLAHKSKKEDDYGIKERSR